MIRFAHFAAIVICVVFGFRVPQSLAQAFDFNLGYYSGISTNAMNLSQGSSTSRWTTKRKPAYLFGLYFRTFLELENRSRFGIKLYLQSAKSNPVNPQKENDALRSGMRWKMSSLLLSYQYKLYQSNPSFFLLDFSGGLSFFSSKLISGFDHCDTPFCNLPKVRVNLSPGLIYIVRVYETFALQINSRYNALLGGSQDIFPFNSGFLFTVGLTLESKK